MDRESNASRDEVIVDYYNQMKGPCGDCCLKFPCPSIIACVCMILGDALLLIGFHLGAVEAKTLFTGTPVSQAFNVWFTNVQVVVYCLSVFMLVMAVVLLAIGCLGTGATRSVYTCRFKSRRSGRCQTSVFLLVSYFLFLCWLTATCFALVPVFFMFIMNHGVCYGVEMDQQTCLNLVQWGLVSPDTPLGFNKEFVCGVKLENICNSNLMAFFSFAFLGCLLMLLASVQFTINMSSNFAQLLDRYKRAYMSGTAGSYNIRSGARNLLRSSKRSTTGRMQNPDVLTNVELTRIGTGNGAYSGNGQYDTSELPEQQYSTLEMPPGLPTRREEPPSSNPPPYLPTSREPLSNLQHRARSFDPLDYNDYNPSPLANSRIKNMSRSAEPIDYGNRYDRYDRYLDYDL